MEVVVLVQIENDLHVTAGNPLKCDCDLSWLLPKNQWHDISNLGKCWTPSHLNGTFLERLQKSDLCSQTETTVPATSSPIKETTVQVTESFSKERTKMTESYSKEPTIVTESSSIQPTGMPSVPPSETPSTIKVPEAEDNISGGMCIETVLIPC